MHVLRCEIDQLSLPAELAHRESVLTVGAFDGIHLGHQALIRASVAQAAATGRFVGLVTFDPHPATVLHPERALRVLTTPQIRRTLLEDSGLDLLVLLSFTPQLASTSARAFVQGLCQSLHMRELWVGPDFALGSSRKGDMAALKEMEVELEYTVRQISYVSQAGQRVSSSQIRTLLGEGRAVEATALLGRAYRVRGKVVHGAQRGRELGFPTANLEVCEDCLVPAYGVYATTVTVDGTCYDSVTNIGVRPSFDNGVPTIEAYILDFNQDLYGRELELAFVQRLRPELRFDNLQALIDQMHDDVAQARQVLRGWCGNRHV
jgi:riboflavin kinase/FMN adenylyltransferase